MVATAQTAVFDMAEFQGCPRDVSSARREAPACLDHREKERDLLPRFFFASAFLSTPRRNLSGASSGAASHRQAFPGPLGSGTRSLLSTALNLPPVPITSEFRASGLGLTQNTQLETRSWIGLLLLQDVRELFFEL